MMKNLDMFRDASGHISDTPANRKLIEDIANDPATMLGVDKKGNSWSAKMMPDGTQAWAQIRDGKVINAGINKTPISFDPNTGLSSPIRPGWK
jgi:filamentous hemagglutinin